MKRTTERALIRGYLLCTGAVTATIGFILLFWPEAILQWFIPGATGDFFISFIGSALIGYATLNILSAEAKSQETQKLALVSNMTTLVIATGLSVYGVTTHKVTQLGWLLIMEHILFVSGFGYMLYLEYKTPQ